VWNGRQGIGFVSNEGFGGMGWFWWIL
jgi:hypothetical protein